MSSEGGGGRSTSSPRQRDDAANKRTLAPDNYRLLARALARTINSRRTSRIPRTRRHVLWTFGSFYGEPLEPNDWTGPANTVLWDFHIEIARSEDV